MRLSNIFSCKLQTFNKLRFFYWLLKPGNFSDMCFFYMVSFKLWTFTIFKELMILQQFYRFSKQLTHTFNYLKHC